MRSIGASLALLAPLVLLGACTGHGDLAVWSPSPLPTTTDPTVANNTACLEYYATVDRWEESMDISEYAIGLRAIIPDADEFMAGQLTNFANALDGIESDVPIGQAEAISGMQIDRVCAEAGVPAPVPTELYYP